jgi:hypothetical protein
LYIFIIIKKKDILFNEDLKKDKNKLIDEGNESIKELDYDQESLWIIILINFVINK